MNVGLDRFARGSTVAVACVGIALVGACARQGAPPGGPEDRRPPVVVRTEPDTFATLDDPRASVRFHFDERISERVEGTLDDIVIVSPETGDVRVRLGRRSLTVDIEGGFRPGLVYRVTLLPAVRDLFSNQQRDPFELVFSTGSEFAPSVVAGLVWDRITGDGVDPAEVRAIGDSPDSVMHVARTDADGVYAFRYLPPGRYRMVAFQDRNRDGIVDAMETQGEGTLRLNEAADSVLNMSIALLTPDTTAPRITGTEILDSVTVALEFDDYLDPALDLQSVGVGLSTDSGSVPQVAELYHEHEYRAHVEAVADSFARLDSLDALARAAQAAVADTGTTTEPAQARDTLDPDTAEAPRVQEAPARRAAPPRTPPTPLGARRGSEPPPRPDGSLPPVQRLVVVFAEALVPNRPYELMVTGLTNINGVTQGGGQAALILEPPPDTTSVPGDSAAVDDTLAAPPDTGSVRLRPEDLFRARRRE